MSENKPLFTVSNFKFSIFDSVPKADNDTAYILYKEGSNLENILVITAQKPAIGSTVRSGGFNKIAEVSLAWRELGFQKEIADQTNNFRFYITVKLKYRISDCVYVFRSRTGNIEETIRSQVAKLVEDCHKNYDIESQIELENDLKNQIVEQLQGITYLESREVSVVAELDERATEIINSTLDVMAKEVVDRNENEKLTRKIEEEKAIKIKQLEAETEIQQRKNALNIEKAEGMKALEEKLGGDYGTFLAYINGEISSTEFDSRIQQNRNTAMMAKLQYFKQLVDLDVLSGPALERAAVKLLGEDGEEKPLEQQMIADSSTADNIVVVEDTEEY